MHAINVNLMGAFAGLPSSETYRRAQQVVAALARHDARTTIRLLTGVEPADLEVIRTKAIALGADPAAFDAVRAMLPVVGGPPPGADPALVPVSSVRTGSRPWGTIIFGFVAAAFIGAVGYHHARKGRSA